MNAPVVDRKKYFMWKHGDKLHVSNTSPSDQESMEIVVFSHKGQPYQTIFIDNEKLPYEMMLEWMKAYTHQKKEVLEAMGELTDTRSKREILRSLGKPSAPRIIPSRKFLFSKRLTETDRSDLLETDIAPVNENSPDEYLDKTAQMLSGIIAPYEQFKVVPLEPDPNADPLAYNRYPPGIKPGDLTKLLKEQNQWAEEERKRRTEGPEQRGWRVG